MMQSSGKETKHRQELVVQSGPLIAHCVRLEPGADLIPSLFQIVRQTQSSALCILSAVGSLEEVKLRMANACRTLSSTETASGTRKRKRDESNGDDGDDSHEGASGPADTTNGSNDHGGGGGENSEQLIKTWNERLEIVSFVGTFGIDNTKHLHMSVSDKNGNVYGGHVMSGKIYTTLELVLGSVQGVTFARESDPRTGYTELVVKSSSVSLLNFDKTG